uniref:Uncharacterized protein n=1 Tax=Mycolicibacterium aurum TaxID=1791 RepID=A0A448IZJ7_MYCAU|nr:hypothetical protein [Mycolicibacterium aurum]VEG57775.1 Uncharacterised protein [Mycolicibacterium aurum]
MFYTRPTLWTRLHRIWLSRSAFRPLAQFAAGLSTAHGLAHGVRPSPTSAARRLDPDTRILDHNGKNPARFHLFERDARA